MLKCSLESQTSKISTSAKRVRVRNFDYTADTREGTQVTNSYLSDTKLKKHFEALKKLYLEILVLLIQLKYNQTPATQKNRNNN